MHRRHFLITPAPLAIASLLPVRAQADAVPWPKGLPAPALQAKDLAGRRWDLAALQGRAVLVNFWATWCPPCLAELPSMQALADQHGPDRLVVLCVNVRESAAKVARFVQTTGLRLPVLLDADGAITQAWNVNVFPTSVLVGADGQPSRRIRGELDWTGAQAQAWLRPLLPVKPASAHAA